MGLAHAVGFDSNKRPYRKPCGFFLFFWLHLHKLSLLLTSHWKRRGGNAVLPWESTLNKPAVLAYLLTEKQKNSERIPYPRGKNCTASQTQRGCMRDHRTSTCFKNKRVFCKRMEGLGCWRLPSPPNPAEGKKKNKAGTCSPSVLLTQKPILKAN